MTGFEERYKAEIEDTAQYTKLRTAQVESGYLLKGEQSLQSPEKLTIEHTTKDELRTDEKDKQVLEINQTE